MLRSLLPALRAGAASCRHAAPRSLSTLAPWLTGAPPTVDLTAQTFAALYYGRVLAQEPSKDAAVSVDTVGEDVRFTVAEMHKQVAAYALGMLEGLGLKKGSKVGLWMGSEWEHATLRCALGLLGVEAVVIDPAVGFAGVRAILESEGLHALVLSPRHGAENRHGALRTEFAPELQVQLSGSQGTNGNPPIQSKRFRSLKHIVCASLEHDDAVGPLHGVIRLNDLPVYGPYDFDEIAALQAYVQRTDSLVRYYGPGASASAPVLVQGSPFSHASLLASASAAGASLALGATDVLLSTVPLHTPGGYSAGLLAPLLAGCKVLRPTKAAFDAGAVLACVTQQRPSKVLLASSEQAAALGAAAREDGGKKYDLSSVKGGAVLAGGAGALGSVALKAL